MKNTKPFVPCRGADIGMVSCDRPDCGTERHPAILFNQGCECKNCEIGIMFKDFEQIEAFARSILFNLAERKVQSEI